jgi:hypothetical protein
MYDISELEELRKIAPAGQYCIPADNEVRCRVLVIGDVKKSVTKDWFAIFPDPSEQAAYEKVLIDIVETRLGL